MYAFSTSSVISAKETVVSSSASCPAAEKSWITSLPENFVDFFRKLWTRNIYLEKHKLVFFLNGFDWFFWSLRRCILYRQMWPYMFFFNISVRLFFNKMLKNYGFAMPLASEPRPYMAIFAHIWPYMTIFFGHPESTASIRFDHCFWSLRVIVVIDEIFCVLCGLAKTTEKKHVYVVTGSWWFQPIWNILVKLDHLPK